MTVQGHLQQPVKILQWLGTGERDRLHPSLRPSSQQLPQTAEPGQLHVV
jgi:hypothetical protein